MRGILCTGSPLRSGHASEFVNLPTQPPNPCPRLLQQPSSALEVSLLIHIMFFVTLPSVSRLRVLSLLLRCARSLS
jgi:hypothetical protein